MGTLTAALAGLSCIVRRRRRREALFLSLPAAVSAAGAALPDLQRRATGARPSALPATAATAVADELQAATAESAGVNEVVRVLAIVGDGSVSPLKGAPWEEVMRHTVDRLKWVDEGLQMQVFTENSFSSHSEDHEILREELSNADLLISIAVTSAESVDWLSKNSGAIPNIICLESSPSLQNKLGGECVYEIATRSNMKKSSEILRTVSDAWKRYNSDDIRFCILVIINSYVRPVAILKNLRAKGISTLSCMLRNCRSQILKCLLDPNCRKAIQCLNSCSPTDQVCNYRCIASYESPNLEAFSLCVLQKHNCLGLDAEIPDRPGVAPLARFRGDDLTHESAEDLFIGWLGDLQWSWRVVAGQNPAYDQFPCQYQLFYRGKANGSFWYEPVFQVQSLEGKLVWRRRRYRVRRASSPGTFYFSVLDNGVVSKEFWTIVDVSDDLGWGLFHYRGAAQAAGLSYTGAVLVSPDGAYPPRIEDRRIESALEKCGIKKWELYDVNNCSCVGATLELPEGSHLHSIIKATTQ